MRPKKKYTYTIFKTKWGYFGICSTQNGIVRTCLPVKTKAICKKFLTRRLNNAVFQKSLCLSLQKAVMRYYKGTYADFKETIDWSEFTPFTRKVLQACTKVSYGRTKTYKELAHLAGNPNAARAVGGVMARNPIPLIIPCHRILSSENKLCGFSAAGGLKTKKKMLLLEKSQNP